MTAANNDVILQAIADERERLKDPAYREENPPDYWPELELPENQQLLCRRWLDMVLKAPRKKES